MASRLTPFHSRHQRRDRARPGPLNIYCTPCHDHTGYGNGMIVRRGYRHPPSYHTDKIRQLSNGFIFDVITQGFGAIAGPRRAGSTARQMGHRSLRARFSN